MNNLYLVARIAGTDVAIPTREVESVVSVGEIVPVPAAAKRIAGLFALRSRVVTMIDGAWTVSGERTDIQPGAIAIVTAIGGHIYGFVAERVEDVLTIEPDRIMDAGGIALGWSDVATGVATMDERALLIVSLEHFINAPGRLAA
ncbi:chemotaxis protein CheW [Novosphingopyxis sp.]|uniref:chemotaxis protein CheW n=1 Tax=Novosphingopyxis sp. TaxID=2709690 RepID=UPI003B58E2C2